MFRKYFNSKRLSFDKMKSFILSNLQPATPQLVGLDFSAEKLKILKIDKTVSPILVEKYAVVPIPAGAIVKDEIKDIALIAQLLKTAFIEAGLTAKEVALSIPRSQAIIKNIPIDSRLTEGEIESRAWMEANRQFPDLVGEIYLDFAVNPPEDPKSNQAELVLVACRKDQIKPYLEVLNQAGLVPKLIDISSFALERALPYTIDLSATHTFALLNLNLTVSSLIVVQKTSMMHAHDQSFDGKRFLSQIKTLTDAAPANQLTLDNSEYLKILNENFITHLRHTLHLFYSTRPNVTIDKFILAGDCASAPFLSDFIKREISIETEVANPFKRMQLGSQLKAEALEAVAPELMLCCGLTLS